MDLCSRRILLAIAGLLCLMGQVSGGRLPTIDKKRVETIDQILMNAAKQSVKPKMMFLSANSPIRTEYDMLFTRAQWKALQGRSARREKRTAASKEGVTPRWTNNHVFYQIQPDVFSDYERNEITKAMNEVSNHTCVTFEESNTAENRIYIRAGDGGCYSYVGMIGGRQDLGLVKGCRRSHIIVHELAHALGIFHEQSRTDRDDHLTIHFDRIPNHLETQFQKREAHYVDLFDLPYDYWSVMHYGPTAFASIPGQMTIQTKDPQYQDIIGTAPGLSLLDIRTINNMHSCVPESCAQTDCGSEGFVGKDCKCWCPGPDQENPVKLCNPDDDEGGDDDDDGVSEEVVEGCEDIGEGCSFWSSIGFCNFAHIKTDCKLTCNKCD